MGDEVETKELTRAEQNWKGGNKVASVKEEAPAPGLKSREGKIKTVGEVRACWQQKGAGSTG